MRTKVRFINNKGDLDCLILGSLGFSIKYIASKVGMTEGRVGYRLRKGGVSVRSWRNGESQFAQFATQKMLPDIKSRLMKGLERYERKQLRA